ncbi:MAG: hypothetical protein HFJ86_02855 [Oscillospiraceae bacterium]|jgi:hypothetical protein|nr:hypothetical protein [Oscillospiraceae bacterium]
MESLPTHYNREPPQKLPFPYALLSLRPLNFERHLVFGAALFQLVSDVFPDCLPFFPSVSPYTLCSKSSRFHISISASHDSDFCNAAPNPLPFYHLGIIC